MNKSESGSRPPEPTSNKPKPKKRSYTEEPLPELGGLSLNKFKSKVASTRQMTEHIQQDPNINVKELLRQKLSGKFTIIDILRVFKQHYHVSTPYFSEMPALLEKNGLIKRVDTGKGPILFELIEKENNL